MNLNEPLVDQEPAPSDEELADMYQQFLQQATPEHKQQLEELQSLQEKVTPTPGCCIKTKDMKTSTKVFINVCTSSNVPAPQDITESRLKELIYLLDDENAVVDYRVPMSIGEPHAELDKKNTGCTAYDIIINPAYLQKIRDNEIFLGFFMSVVIEGIFNKYEVELDRKWILLKRKKVVGSLQEQYMRKKRLIQEVHGSSSAVPTPVAEKPKLRILREPEEGHPQYLIAEIELPKASRAKAISVDVGEDRLVMSVKPHLYELDVYLPYKLIQEECGSQFNVNTKILTLTMPVQPA
uniref:PIH1 domain-containing protein 1-like isoform X2 n=1 Tax=Styela clava TaxID=7725 RepID=UPI0019395836|nr:PIH1 domain-containing protein 1-like isoform X2 [Styela clava]